MIFKRFKAVIIYIIIFIVVLCFLVNFFGIDRVTSSERNEFISGVVAIFVFGAGLLAQIIGNKVKQWEKDKQLKRVFNENLRIIINGLDLQLKNFTNIIVTLNSPYPEKVMLSSYAELDYFEINKISSEELYRIFIDFQKGKEQQKISNLENLRKELRFIEHSRDLIFTGFEKLYDSFHTQSDLVMDGITELGRFFDKQATTLLSLKISPDSDNWFVAFSNLWGKTQSALKISEDTFTDYEKLEKEIIPKYFEFAKNNIEDTRTPIITVAICNANSAIYQRKDALRKMIEYIRFYIEKYEEAKNTVERSIFEYYNNK